MQSIRANERENDIPWVPRYLHYAFTAAPLSAIAALNLLAWRAAVKLGHWPVPWQDDPKCIAPNDVLFQVLYPSVMLLLLGAAASIFFFPLLMLALGHTYSWLSRCILVLIFAGGWVLLTLDPGARFTWLLD